MAKSAKNEQKPAQRYSVDKKPDGTIVIKAQIPVKDVERVREEIVNELVKSIELPGFRKGAAPRKLAEEKLNSEAVREEILKKVLTDGYVAAIKASNINPIVNPRIHIEQFAEGTDLVFEAETCETPSVNLKNYKDEVRKIKPAPKIIVPHSTSSGQAGKDEAKEEPGKKLDEILAAILNVSEIRIPRVLIDQETNRLLSQLLDEIKRLGVSLDQYLTSRAKTEADLRKEYEERAEKDLKLEFLLRKIADEEKITVEQKEIDDALAAIKDEKQKKDIAQNPYLVASIIRQQKTLNYLTTL